MSITPLPPAPAVTDTTAEFNTKAFNWVAALDTFTTETNAVAEICSDAEVTASAALAVVGAEAWVSGTTYAIGDPVYSPIDMQTYRRKISGAGTTDPSADSTNWEKVAINAPTATQAEMEAGTETALRSMSPSLVADAISALVPPSGAKTWTAFTSSGTYTVPAGISSIRAYAIGAGGNGAASISSPAYAGGGGGGGMAYGDIAVVAGQTVTVAISAGVATVTYGGTTLLTANKGGDGTTASGNNGGAGGTATKHASVTNGGAYTGGAGGSSNTTNRGGGGGSSGSPLGNGYRGGNAGGGGAGIGGIGGDGANFGYPGGGGGAGGSGGTPNTAFNNPGAGGGGGAGGDAQFSIRGGFGRNQTNLYTDPLIAHCVSPGASTDIPPTNEMSSGENGNPGGGGAAMSVSRSSVVVFGCAGNGGDFAGGGAVRQGDGNSGSIVRGGNGGICGGGGGAIGVFFAYGGNGGYGGGGGGASSPGGSVGTAGGTGGGALVLIYA